MSALPGVGLLQEVAGVEQGEDGKYKGGGGEVKKKVTLLGQV